MSRRPVEVDADVVSLAQSGEGIVRHEGRTVLVRGTLPGDRVRVRIDARDTMAQLVAIVVPHEARIVPRCPVVDTCGGCAWQHVPRTTQSEARLDQLRRALPAAVRTLPIAWHAAPDGYEYRTRARLAWRASRSGVQLGFRQSSRHDVIDAAPCAVLVRSLREALAPLRAVLADVGSSGEVSLGVGEGGRPVATLRPVGIAPSSAYAAPQRLVDAGFAGAALRIEETDTLSIVGDARPVTTGGDGLALPVAVDGFAQANDAVNVMLAEHVVREIDAKNTTVLELFAGAGNLTVALARVAKRVTAVESDASACRQLRANVDARGLRGVTVLCGDAAENAARGGFERVVLDPPRAGARDVCEHLRVAVPARVVYVSCDVATLGRDLDLLGGVYEVTSLAAFEMFPQTPHVETVATLVRRSRRR